MPDQLNIEQLTELFRDLGARDPEGWARSQLQEGIPQLHRFLFLRQAWTTVISEDDESWIEQHVADAKRRPTAPYSGVGLALERLLASGASRADLVDVVRGMQAQTMFSLCYLLDDPSLTEPEVEDLGWALVETDKDYAATTNVIGGLHESQLSLDPTGREMRPRKREA